MLVVGQAGVKRRRCYSAAVTDGHVIASGRDAEMVDLGGGRLLRRPRVPRPLDGEAVVMRLARAAGYPVPEVHEVRPDGMVMERVDGPTMLDDLAAHPWRVGRHARTLADLHRRLHAVPADDALPARLGPPEPSDVLVHGDLHPANVLLSRNGPVVIDWSNAGRGPAGADVADAWLLLATAEAPVGLLMRVVVTALRARFLDEFLRRAGREEAARHLTAAARRRTADPNLSETEKTAMRRLAAAHGTP
jgi:aminoglycoside phosphotransferase (APT) family kinase protein